LLPLVVLFVKHGLSEDSSKAYPWLRSPLAPDLNGLNNNNNAQIPTSKELKMSTEHLAKGFQKLITPSCSESKIKREILIQRKSLLIGKAS
jgi:hypothetical protein